MYIHICIYNAGNLLRINVERNGVGVVVRAESSPTAIFCCLNNRSNNDRSNNNKLENQIVRNVAMVD